MDKQTKYLLMVVGATIVVLWILKPKNNIISSTSNSGDKLSAPKIANSKVTEEQHNGVVSIEAMRSAISNGERKNELDRLNRII